MLKTSIANFAAKRARRHDLNDIRWLPVLLDAANNYYVRIDQRLVALSAVPEEFGIFQRFERVPIKRLYNTATGALVPAA